MLTFIYLRDVGGGEHMFGIECTYQLMH